MKIAHLCTSDFGGAAMAAIQLHLELLKRNEQSVFITLTKTRDDIPNHFNTNGFDLMSSPSIGKIQYKIKAVLQKSGLIDDTRDQPDNRHLQNRSPKREVFTLPYSYFNILEHPEVRTADIVHLHWVSFGMIDYKKFFKNVKQPVVWTMHDMYPFTGGCHHADECRLFTESCFPCPQLPDSYSVKKWWTYKLDAIADLSAEQMSLVSPSEWLAEKSRQSTLFKKFPVTVIRNGFDTTVFNLNDKIEARKVLQLPEDKILFLFNSYDLKNKRKGVGDLLEVFKTITDSNIALVCIGSAGSSELSITNILNHGYISDSKIIAQYYNACDFFILPSKAENLPNTISESLLCGTPVIANNVGGVPEQLNQNNGILVDYPTASLKNAIQTALQNKASFNREKISTEAREKFGINSIGSEYLNLYRSLLK